MLDQAFTHRFVAGGPHGVERGVLVDWIQRDGDAHRADGSKGRDDGFGAGTQGSGTGCVGHVPLRPRSARSPTLVRAVQGIATRVEGVVAHRPNR